MSASMIAEVEEALRRLMEPTTPPPAKVQLEQQLTQFKSHVHSCLPVVFQLLSASSNEYALWFAATTLEEYVATRWRQFPRAQQQHIRQFVWENLLSRRENAAHASGNPPFVARKLRKVVADIARIEWTASDALWPDFMSQVEALIMENATRMDGVALLRVVAEEFGRDDALALAATKRRAKAQLSAQLPSLLSLLAGVLQASSHHIRHENDGLDAHDRLASVALDTLSHLIAWAPVADAMSDVWVPLLMEWSGTRPHVGGASLVALQCLSELVGKRVSPARVDALVTQTFQGLCLLIQETVDDTETATEEYLDKLTELLEAFLTQHLARLERSLATQQDLPQFLALVLRLTQRQPHVSGFLHCLGVWEVFVSFVEEREANGDGVQQQLAAYESGLVGVMFHLLDRVSFATNAAQLQDLGDEDDDEDDDQDGEAKTSSTDALLLDADTGEARFLTASLQDLAQWWTARASGLALSEYKQFVVECIALIRRIAAFQACRPPLLEHLATQVQAASASLVFTLHETPALPAGSQAWTRERQQTRDLTVHCAVLASVCAQHNGVSQDAGGWDVLLLFVELASYLAQHRVHLRGAAFVDLQCEALASVRFALTCVPFMQQQQQGQGLEEEEGGVLATVEQVIELLLRVLDASVVPSPPRVLQTATQLLASLGYVLDYDALARLPAMAQLQQHVHAFSQPLPLKIQGDLFAALANSILNAAISMTRGATNQEAMRRWAAAYDALLRPLGDAVDATAAALQQNEHRVMEGALVAQLTRDLYLVRRLARAVETKPTLAKDAFCAGVAVSLPSFLALLQTYVAAIKRSQARSVALQVVDEIVRLYAQLLKSVRKQMSKEHVGDVMRIFVQLFNDAPLSNALASQGTPGLTVLCGFLQLLTIVVEEPTAAFASFLQSILDLCFGPLQEAIFNHAESEAHVLGHFVALAEQLLEKHYRFFVSPATISASGQRERGFASDAAHAYFVSIFQSLAAVLDGATSLSPRLCRQVLSLLDRVDATQSVFAFAGFQAELRLGFLSTLMRILTKGELNLLQDEVISLLHRLAAVDFQSFYQVFLPAYTREALTAEELALAQSMGGQCLEWTGQTDVPTFTSEVLGFLNDLRVLRAQQSQG